MTPPVAAAETLARPRGRAGTDVRRAPVRHPRRISGPSRPTGPVRTARPLTGPRRSGRTSARPRSAPRLAAPSGRRGLALRALERYERVCDSALLDRLVRGRLWIGLLAFSLIGIVAMQLLVLRLNNGIGATLQRAAALQRANAQLGIEAAGGSGEGRIEPLAAATGMTFAAPGSVHFVAASPSSDVSRAAAALAAPIQPREYAAASSEASSGSGETAGGEASVGGSGEGAAAQAGAGESGSPSTEAASPPGASETGAAGSGETASSIEANSTQATSASSGGAETSAGAAGGVAAGH